MELCVSTTASVRATAAPISFFPPRRGASASTALPLHRRIPTRGWRCASAAAPDPVPSEEPASVSASYTVAVTEKPADTPADDKVEEVSAAPSASTEAPVAELVVSSEASPSPSPDGSGLDLDEILSKLNIEVTPTLILTGSAAFLALWVLSSVVAAIDSVPLLPKLLELVGTGYTIWFISRNLLFKVHLFLMELFKENRDDLFAKFGDFVQRII